MIWAIGQGLRDDVVGFKLNGVQQMRGADDSSRRTLTALLLWLIG